MKASSNEEEEKHLISSQEKKAVKKAKDKAVKKDQHLKIEQTSFSSKATRKNTNLVKPNKGRNSKKGKAAIKTD